MKAIATNLLLLFLFCFSLAPCLARTDPGRTDKFHLEIQGENNLFPMGFTLKEIGEELSEGEKISISRDFLSKNSIFLSLPLWKRETLSLGFTFRKADFIQVTGQTLRFYQDYNNPTFSPVKKNYDLAGSNIDYSLLGTYVATRWYGDSLLIALRGDIFTCYDYLKINMAGQGLIKKKINGSKDYEVYGCYRREWSDAENPWGWGLGLSWELCFKQNGLDLYLNLLNLPGWVYFPKLLQENGRVDTEGGSIGPITIKEFESEGAKYLSLPLAVKAQLLYTWSYGGSFTFETYYGGEIQDFLCGYQQPLGQVKLVSSVNPVFKNYGLGLALKYGELIFFFSLDTPTRLQGITFKFQL
ncbi:MAG TPA: hypothetical protein DEB05_01390 [Firmicutes bacterium]|nr:hypothetical protein [Bacillota bacterium]